jgi:DMSO/TMAO reductase YedYZ molybdopterin-dependent catalytic subunit
LRGRADRKRLLAVLPADAVTRASPPSRRTLQTWTTTERADRLVARYRIERPEAGAVEVVFRGADRGIQGEQEQSYARSLPLSEASRPDVLLAYEMNGRALEPQHGFPLRLIVLG